MGLCACFHADANGANYDDISIAYRKRGFRAAEDSVTDPPKSQESGMWNPVFETRQISALCPR